MSTDEPDIYDAVAELRDKERLKEVRENRRVWHGGMGQTTRDIDFLLSYVDELESKHTTLRGQLAALSNKVCSRDNTIHTLQSRLAQVEKERDEMRTQLRAAIPYVNGKRRQLRLLRHVGPYAEGQP